MMDGCRLIIGDCADVLTGIDAASVDLTVTSPPYDGLREYGGKSSWDASKFDRVASELYRVTKDGGVVVWVVGDQTRNGSESGTSFRQALGFMECGFNLHDTMICQKAGSPYPDKTRYRQQFEYMFVLSKGRPKTVNLIRDRPNKWVGRCGGNHRGGTCVRGEYGVRFNVWKYDHGLNNSTRYADAFKHPAIFPEALARDHIASWSNSGDTVLDPFMGSGTTGVEAVRANRKFVGIEINPDYVEISRKRIEHETAQAELFGSGRETGE